MKKRNPIAASLKNPALKPKVIPDKKKTNEVRSGHWLLNARRGGQPEEDLEDDRHPFDMEDGW